MRRVIGLLILLGMASASITVVRSETGLEGNPSLALAPTVALAPDGQPWAAWVADTGDDWEIVTSRWNGQAWGLPEPVLINPGRWDASPSLTFDAEGVAWLAWSSSTGTDDLLHVSYWTGRGWSKPDEPPFQDTVPNRQPVLAPDPRGGLWLAWVGFDGNDDEIYAAFWDGQAWSRSWRVSSDDPDPEAYDTQPRLAVGPDGAAWVAWVSHQALYDTEIYTSQWDGNRWLPEEQVNDDDGTPDVFPSLVVDGGGRRWLAWHGWAESPHGPQARIYAASGQAEHGWTAEQLVSSPVTTNLLETQPSLALDPSGHPHLLWIVDSQPSGLGYTTFDGNHWSPPTWAIQGLEVEEALLLFDQRPTLYWIPAVPSGQAALARQPLADERTPIRPQSVPPVVGDVVPNRHLAFGDSITAGQYQDPPGTPIVPYPARLEQKLDLRVVASEVVNGGEPSERTQRGMFRLKNDELPLYHPNFVEIMEGTNDVTHLIPYDEVAWNLELMVFDSRNFGAKPVLATLIPRRDSFNDETYHQNTYIASLAARKNVPLVDTWGAFYAYGRWQDLYVDTLHPNSQGMQILADTFYNVLTNSFSWLHEETEPPTTWIASVQGECKQAIVTWDGSDNLNWVVDYDVQVKVNAGAWTDWLMATEESSAIYTGGNLGDTLYFRVRGRDLLGNQSDYSLPLSIGLYDTIPPEAFVHLLPPYQLAPFTVSWGGSDTCSDRFTYAVQYKVGATGGWQDWFLPDPTATHATFTPSLPQYGQTYYFHVRAQDPSGNWSLWSDETSTVLAPHGVSGQVYNVRHRPVVGAGVDLDPAAAYVEPLSLGGFTAYLLASGDYDIQVSRSDLFGDLPPMKEVGVSGHVEGLEFILPPQDDVVIDGDFEQDTLSAWQTGGTVTTTPLAYTGSGAILMGGAGESWLKQSLTVPASVTDATLSFLVRLNNPAEVSSTLNVALEGTSIGEPVTVTSDGWAHVWLPVDVAVGQVVTITFTISDRPVIRLDEVSLGSALQGGGWSFLPITLRTSTP